jgi:hypothetical protein
MIYGEGQRAPVMMHKTFASAKTEANRLARQAPGVRFFILEAVAAAERVDVQFTDFRLDGKARNVRDLDAEIPF